MERKVIKVNLFDKSLGFLSLENNGIVFQYSDEFLESNIEAAPITMPIANGNKLYNFKELSKVTFQGLPGLISDSLPDRFGQGLIKELFLRLGIDKPTVLQCLAYIGNRAIGALSFEPELKEREGTELLDKELDIKSLVHTAKQAFFGDMKNIDNDFMKIASFAGGARAKALINFNTKTKQINLANSADYQPYLIKFDGISSEDVIEPQGYGRIEYAYYLMAKKIGIDIMPSQLLEDGGIAHFITKRFDTVNNEDYHIQTFGSLAHLDFHTPQDASYSDYFAIIKGLNMSYKYRLEGFTRMLFNIVGKNYDDHVKNFSFKMNKEGDWTLAPAYDLVYAHNNHNPVAWTKSHNMTINSKGNAISFEDIVIEAKILELKKEDIYIVFEKVFGVFSFWEHYANLAGVDFKRQRLIGKQINDSIKLAKIGLI